MKKAALYVCVLLLSLLMSGCISETLRNLPPKPELGISFILPEKVISTSPQRLNANLVNQEDYSLDKYEWTATGGLFDAVDTVETTWYAPKKAGTYTVTFSAYEDGIAYKASMEVEVVESPLAVQAVTLPEEFFSSNKKLKVTFRNNHPEKVITAFKIEAALWDAFGERLPNFRGYADRESVEPGESITLSWALDQPRPMTAIVYVWQIQYSDGAGWKVEID